MVCARNVAQPPPLTLSLQGVTVDLTNGKMAHHPGLWKHRKCTPDNQPHTTDWGKNISISLLLRQDIENILIPPRYGIVGAAYICPFISGGFPATVDAQRRSWV